MNQKDEMMKITIVKMNESTNAILEKYYTNWVINLLIFNITIKY